MTIDAKYRTDNISQKTYTYMSSQKEKHENSTLTEKQDECSVKSDVRSAVVQNSELGTWCNGTHILYFTNVQGWTITDTESKELYKI